MLCRLFFFFQAEDGIRDYKVTGVQTCALPIFTLSWEPGCAAGRVSLKVEPLPSCDVTHILPPFCSMILRQMAKPIPLPGYSVRVCSRLNMTKISWQYSGAMPMPLSATENTHSFSCLSAVI